MADFAESVAGEGLNSCIQSVKRVYSSIKSYKGNLKLLQDNIQSLSAKKADIVRKVEVGESALQEVTNEATVWLENVKALLEDEEVNDLLNDDLRRAKDQCCFGLFLCNLYHRYGMSRLAKSKVDEINRKLDQFPQDPITVPKRIMDLDPIPTQHCKGLDSRGMVEQRILELLKDEQVDAVGICGMGGIGKTTLAKTIKNKGAKDMFDAILMVEISQVANIERIQNHIAAFMDLSLDDKHSLEQRATKLYNALKQWKPTKILIIMDNIWADLNLDEVGIPRETTPQFCCKLLFTSRERKVCKSMGVPDKNIVDVSLLGEDDSRLLFWEQIKNVDRNKVESLEDRLLKSCGGLPLAIVTLAKSLSAEDVSTWLHFAEELEKPIYCQSDEVHDEGTFKVIEASYKFIKNYEKKMFFLLACLYPFGSWIPVENLMRYGIGLNLFKRVDSLTDVIKQANRWTDELISSSLLLPEDDSYGERIVKVHDVVRSYAILCAEKDGQKMMVEAIPQWEFGESWEKYTAISLTNVKDYSSLTGMRFDILETLILEGSLWDFKPKEHDDDLFQGIARLKVLQLSGLGPGLPKSITTLTHLRTLHLEGCILQDGDVEMVCELVRLVVLSLRGSDVKMLPNGMKKLSHLRLLDLHGCRSLTIPANVISNLTQLEGLYMLGGCKQSWQDNSSEIIGELRSLHRLKVLEIQFNRIEQVTLSDMEFITSLPKFKFYFYINPDEMVECLKLSSVDFEVEFGYPCEWVWKYPCLKTLLANSNYMEISSIDDDEGLVENLVPNLDREGFRVLGELQLSKLPRLKRICDGHVPPQMFCNLRILQLRRLENLESYVLPIDVAPNLTTLSVESCQKLKFIWMTHVAFFPRKEFRCLKYLSLRDLPNLLHALGNDDSVKYSTSIDFHIPQALFSTNKTLFPSLEELKIEGSSMYDNVWDWDIPNTMQETSARASPHFSHFPNLRKLVIKGVSNTKIGIGSPSMAATLVHLESLQIKKCKKMKQVISEETKEEIETSSNINITFSKLHFLKLGGLEELECMYGGSYKVEFPTLKTMYLLDIPNMTRFVGPENTVRFLPKQVLSNLQHLTLEWMTYVPPIDAVPNLITLSVRNYKKLKYIWMENVTQKEETYELPCLKVLKLGGLDNLLQALGNENVNSSSISKLQPLFNTKIVFPSLEELKISGSSKYEKVLEWDIRNPMQQISASASPHLSSFPNLRKLQIYDANNLKIGIGSPSIAAALVNLETLQIEHCEKMKQVISEETEEEIEISSNIVITFPKLRLLQLIVLGELECMYGGSCKVEFPTLKEMKLARVPNMTRFFGPENSMNFLSKKVEFPSLEELIISEEMPLATRSINFYSLFQNLRTLFLSQLKWKQAFSKDMVATIGLTQLNHLERLYISDCKNMEAVVDEIDEEAMPSSSSSSSPYLEFPRLSAICLFGCSKLRWFFSTRNAKTVLHLPSLQVVDITYCDDMELFSNGPIKVPKLAQVQVKRFSGDTVHEMPDGGDLNKFIRDLHKSYHS